MNVWTLSDTDQNWLVLATRPKAEPHFGHRRNHKRWASQAFLFSYVIVMSCR